MNGADGELGIALVRMRLGDSDAISSAHYADSRAAVIARATVLVLMIGVATIFYLGQDSGYPFVILVAILALFSVTILIYIFAEAQVRRPQNQAY